jgi:hypothetical protein
MFASRGTWELGGHCQLSAMALGLVAGAKKMLIYVV